ncbi:mannose-1-phosphate guanyltransferase [Porphyromonadaceae bacterium COT-184 OH4590]|nr:mannose-1-phosphate guanyltransferase [Porphyromonadaceae bacterium COT-184 OH4590]
MSYSKRTALIFAAGLGTRLRPLTDDKPKALVTIGNKTLLEIAIGRLQKAGFDHIVINAHHFAEQIFDFVAKTHFDANIYISYEKEQLLDTGGGILYAKQLLGNKPFLAYNVDIISDLDVEKFYATHREENLATLLVSDRQTSRYLLFDKNNHLAGWKNVKTDELKTPFADFDERQYIPLAFNGIHVISPRIFSLMQCRTEPFSITDFYLSVCDKERIVAYQQPDLQVTDVGKIEQLKVISNVFI